MATASEAAGVTNAKYWDKAAEDWDDFQDTFATDDSGVIKRALCVHCNRQDECIDFGCGGGRYLAFLATRVRTILGLDVSQALLDIAEKDVVRRRKLSNVTLRCADLGANGAIPKLKLPPCDLAICANVSLSSGLSLHLSGSNQELFSSPVCARSSSPLSPRRAATSCG